MRLNTLVWVKNAVFMYACHIFHFSLISYTKMGLYYTILSAFCIKCQQWLQWHFMDMVICVLFAANSLRFEGTVFPIFCNGAQRYHCVYMMSYGPYSTPPKDSFAVIIVRYCHQPLKPIPVQVVRLISPKCANITVSAKVSLKPHFFTHK